MMSPLKGWLRSLKGMFFDLAIIFLLGLIPFLKTGVEGIINPYDANFPLYPNNWLIRNLYVWSASVGFFGGDNTLYHIPQLPVYGIFAFLSLGLPVAIIERIWFVFVFSLSGWSMYYLMHTLVTGKNKRIAALIAAIFYMYNIWFIGRWWAGGHMQILVYAILPTILAFFIRGLNDRSSWVKYPLLIGCASVLLSSGTVQIFALQGWVFVLYLVFYMIIKRRSKEEILRSFRFTAITISTVLLFNFYWILPAVSNHTTLLSFYGTQYAAKGFPIQSEASFLNPLLLLCYGLIEPTGLPWEPYYSSSYGYIVGIFIVILIYLALLFKNNREHSTYFALASLFFIIIIALAQVFPWREIYLWLMANLPLGLGYLIFPKNLRFYHLIALCYAFLLGICSSNIYGIVQNSMKSRSKACLWLKRVPLSKAAVIMIAFLILGHSWPFMTGNLSGALSPVNIPSYYDEASIWLLEDEDDFRIFALPHPNFWGYIRYKWSPYTTVDIIVEHFPKPVVERMPTMQVEPGIVKFATESLPHKNLEKILALMDVRYVLLRNDVYDGDYFHFKDSLQQQEGLHLEKSFGNLSFYKNEYSLLRLYAISEVVLLENDHETFQVVPSDSLIPDEDVLFLSE